MTVSPFPADFDAAVQAADVACELSHARERLRLLFDHAPIGNAIVTPDGRFVEVNAAFCELLGYTEEELLRLTMPEITHPDDLAMNLKFFRRQLAGELNRYSLEKRYIRADGELVWVVVSSSLVRDDAGEPQVLIGQIEDITERKRAEDELRTSEARFRQVNESVPVGIYLLDKDFKLVHHNAKLLELLDVEPAEIAGSKWLDHFADGHRRDLEGKLQTLMTSGGEDDAELRTKRRNGDEAWFHVRRRPMLDDAGNTTGIVGVVEDVTERRRFEELLAHQATHDPLTGLANRRLLTDRLAAALDRASTGRVALLLCDLDQFKLVNDSLGHPAGDALLVAVASRLESVLRPGDTLGRFGGDELLIVVDGILSTSDATAVADRVAEAMTPPVTLAGARSSSR